MMTICWVKTYILYRKTQTLYLVTIKQIGPAVNTEKTKYMVMLMTRMHIKITT